MFKDDDCTNIGDHLKVIKLFPSFISKEEGHIFTSEVTIAEVESTLKSFKNDKILGPDGWTIEFFLWFFGLLGKDILDSVELSRREGRVHSPLNYTFITLIPKVENPSTFADFRPISLCNLVYKLIAKITATHLKPFLDSSLSCEQFGFLKS